MRLALKRCMATTAMVASTAIALLTPLAAQAELKVLRVVPSTNLTVLDPIWSTGLVSRNHGYMIYDTLFGMDAQGKIKPQMVSTWTVSKDNKTWTFKLRDGLEFHDGKPVTSEDVVASLKRWASRDYFGGIMVQSLDSYETPDAKTFVMNFKTPFGVVLDVLGKPAANVPFIMPARIAATPGSEQIKESIGSGPYKFVAEEYKPGERVVYAKNEKYKPRPEAPSGTAGAKNVYVDRVEWVIIRDPQTQYNALLAGEVDVVMQISFEHYAALKANKAIKVVDPIPTGLQFIMRFNTLHPPFDNVKMRQAAMVALGQDSLLRVQVGTKDLYKFCTSMYACGSQYASNKTGMYTGKPNPAKSRQMLKEAGYKGEPVVLLRASDSVMISKLPLVAKQQLEAGGFKVDVQQSDLATMLTRRTSKAAPDKGGWNAFITVWSASDVFNPLSIPAMNAAGEKGWVGWNEDKVIEELKVKFVQASSDEERKKIAEQLQIQAFTTVTHVPIGQYNNPSALRSNISGLVPAGAQVYWNIKKN
jgi:peptide/nickel transport system substrate-binding protein